MYEFVHYEPRNMAGIFLCINHQAVSKQQTRKNGMIGKYGHFKRNNIKQVSYGTRQNKVYVA